MFYGKKIKQLEERVAALDARLQNLVRDVDLFAKRVDAQSDEIEKLYMQLAINAAEKTQQSKPKPKRRPRKNGKETPEAAK